MRDLVLLGGLSHKDLTKAICRNLSTEQGIVESKKFSNGETSINIDNSVREKDVFIVQSGCGDVNDNFIELLIMISACKMASAKRVTAVFPLFPYSRQPDTPYIPSTAGTADTKGAVLKTEGTKENGLKDAAPNTELRVNAFVHNGPIFSERLIANSFSPAIESDKSGEDGNDYKQWIAQNGTLVANLLTTAGADRCITMDLHDPLFQGFFKIPIDNLHSAPLFKRYIIDTIPNYQGCVVVSPDSGGAKRATAIADSLGCRFALIHKDKRSGRFHSFSENSSSHPSNMISTTMLVGDVRNRVCILVDDLVDTAFTITRAAKLLKDQGATYVYALASHGSCSGDAVNRIAQSTIDKFVVTNTVPQIESGKILGDKIAVLDVAPIFAESIRRIYNGESVSMLFEHAW